LPSGWFPDPHGRHEHRWFNGTAWTADVADAGQRFIDPLGAAPSYAAAVPKTGNGPATAAITCGLLALLFAWMPLLVVIGFILAVVALVTGWRGLVRANANATGRGTAIAGLVTGGTALGLCVVGVLLSISAIREVGAFIDPEPHVATIDACTVEPGEIVVTGSVQNTGDTAEDFTVYAVVTDPDDVADMSTTLDAVEPGEVRVFELRRTAVVEGDCTARLVVHGPLPWGLEMERVNDQ
jgi:Protein of unknown function (DUF2510)